MQHRLRPVRMPGPVLAIFGCTTQTPVRSPFTRSRFRSKPSSQRSISTIGDLSNSLWQPSARTSAKPVSGQLICPFCGLIRRQSLFVLRSQNSV